MIKQLETLCNFLDEVKAKYPDTPLERHGDIQYCNGNDGTDFDWGVNEHLCEFGCGYGAEGSVWAFKVLVGVNGCATCYCYPNGEPSPVETIKRQLFTPEETHGLYEHMMEFYDNRLNWDCFLVDVEGGAE